MAAMRHHEVYATSGPRICGAHIRWLNSGAVIESAVFLKIQLQAVPMGGEIMALPPGIVLVSSWRPGRP